MIVSSTLKIILLVLLNVAGIIFEPGTIPEAKIIPALSTIQFLQEVTKEKKQEPLSSFEERIVIATAYSPPFFPKGASTYSGQPVNWGVIAVDKNEIPLGSIVYIEDYFPGQAFLALDTGRAIKGAKIDIWMSSKQKASRWGRRRVIVNIVKPTTGP